MSAREPVLPALRVEVNGSDGEFSVRPAKWKDLDAIMEIERASFDTPWTKSSMAQEIEGRDWSRISVAVAGNRVVGFMVYWIVVSELHLLNFAVHPMERHRGVGKAMMGRLVTGMETDRLSTIILEVRVSNEIAQQLYHSFGFTPVSRRAKYYSDNNEDAIVMCLRRS